MVKVVIRKEGMSFYMFKGQTRVSDPPLPHALESYKHAHLYNFEAMNKLYGSGDICAMVAPSTGRRYVFASLDIPAKLGGSESGFFKLLMTRHRLGHVQYQELKTDADTISVYRAFRCEKGFSASAHSAFKTFIPIKIL